MAGRTAVRKIVRIDEDKCTGCGLCVPSCAEGAIRIVNGKAKLAAENLCDGLGNCLGHCPEGAITIEERPAEEFDEAAVARHLSAGGIAPHAPSARADGSPCLSSRPAVRASHHGGAVEHGGCPGSMARLLRRDAAPAAAAAPDRASPARPSQLGQWPVQLALVPVAGPMWQDADVLIAADCVPFAYPEFHERLLAGRKLAVACPKLDDVGPYVEKLTAIFAGNSIRSVAVAHMEVPCCGGIVRAVQEALDRSGRTDVAFQDITVGIEGGILCEE